MATNSNDNLTSQGPEIIENQQKDKDFGDTPIHPLRGIPDDGSYFFGEVERIDPYSNSGRITYINGQEVFSQLASLYKGKVEFDAITQDPKLNPETGKVPPGKFNPEPERPYVQRHKMGFNSTYTERAEQVPKIAPYPTGIETSTAHGQALHTTWRDLKCALGPGYGLVANRYVVELEMPIPDYVDATTLNLLCIKASFPKRTIGVANVYRFGRKYNLRGITEYGDEITLEFLDDSSMSVRTAFDRWAKAIDDSKLQNEGLDIFKTDPKQRVFENNNPDFDEELYNDILPTNARHKNHFLRYGDYLDQISMGTWDRTASKRKEYLRSKPYYQTDIRIYQLDRVGNKVAGYLIQNAWVKGIGEISYDDRSKTELVSFQVTFAYSEFLPMSIETLDEPFRLNMDTEFESIR